MKKYILTVLIVVVALAPKLSYAQSPKTIQLEQTPGVFTQTELTLKAGQSYVFEVLNNGVDHELGFVIAPKGQEKDQKSFIKNSFLQKTIKDGEKSTSKEVVLTKGEYSYYCPLNPTPLYTIKVE